MTTGERINFYRKNMGLSQEDLGQKLLVSRQTVSLWENGQTVPTIDNLIRLKEIFKVSVDEILGCSDENKADEQLPEESYFMNYSKKEVNKISRQINKPWTVKFLITAFAIFMFFASMDYTNETITGAGIIFGIFIAVMFSLIKAAVFNYKNFKAIKMGLVDSNFEYNVYKDCFTVTVSKNGDFNAKYKCRFDKVEKLRDVGAFLFLTVDGRVFILRKEALKANSMFFLVKNISYEKTVATEKGYAIYKGILMALFIATLSSLFIAMIIIETISNESYTTLQNTWVFFTIVPIPLASLIMGFIFKKRGYKCKKNIVAGIIFTVLLCIYGSTCFAHNEMLDYSDAAIIKVEESVGIEIPEPEQVNTVDLSETEQNSTRGKSYYTSYVYYKDSQVIDFEKDISENSMWLKSVPNSLVGITSPLSDYFKGDFFIIYNVDTKQLNVLPEENGTYRFYYVVYNSESNQMKIDEYDIEYVK